MNTFWFKKLKNTVLNKLWNCLMTLVRALTFSALWWAHYQTQINNALDFPPLEECYPAGAACLRYLPLSSVHLCKEVRRDVRLCLDPIKWQETVQLSQLSHLFWWHWCSHTSRLCNPWCNSCKSCINETLRECKRQQAVWHMNMQIQTRLLLKSET